MPQVGEPAPDFSLPGTNGEVRLNDLLEQGRVVLAFYFEDGTPSCTMELRALTEAHAALREAGAQIIALSSDSVASHRALVRRLGGVPFVLASDAVMATTRAYDVVAHDDTGRARRALFVIECDGTVAYVADPFQANNLTQLEEALRAAGVEM